jgi:hypothetical protein
MDFCKIASAPAQMFDSRCCMFENVRNGFPRTFSNVPLLLSNILERSRMYPPLLSTILEHSRTFSNVTPASLEHSRTFSNILEHTARALEHFPWRFHDSPAIDGIPLQLPPGGTESSPQIARLRGLSCCPLQVEAFPGRSCFLLACAGFHPRRLRFESVSHFSVARFKLYAHGQDVLTTIDTFSAWSTPTPRKASLTGSFPQPAALSTL